MSTDQPLAARRAAALAPAFAALPHVVAVALGGSQASGAADAASDIDLYVYTEGALPPGALAGLIEASGGTARADLDLPYWGGVNTWIDAATGVMVDAVVFDAAWMEAQVARVMEAHQPDTGYSTCFCRTVRQSQVLHDPRGWLGRLRERAAAGYPEALRRNIVAFNHPLLRAMMTSYTYQIEHAVARGDVVSVNHRVAALLASYFDIVFALNRVLHPGEKRVLAIAQAECARLPAEMGADIGAVLAAAGAPGPAVLVHLTRLLARLDDLLAAEGLLR